PAWQWIGQFGARGFGEAVSRLMPAGNFLLTLAVIFASTSALNATIFSATRASYALGRDHMLPPVFASISNKTQTPWVALLFTGVIVAVVATLLPTADVASSASIMFLFLFFLVNICVIKIRRNMGDELTYGFLMPLFPVLPVLAIICQGVLAVWLVHMSPIAWIVAPVWIAGGGLIYRFYSKSRVKATEHEILVLEEEEAPVRGDKYRIMVALANPDTALSLVRNTYAICAARNASVELLHMVPVPDQVPLSDADRYMVAGREAIGETMLYLAPQFPSSSTIRYCRNVARGIVSAVREKDTDLLIMGWQGQTISRGFTLGSTLDPVVERVPCNVVIFKDCGDKKFQRVLVPVAGGPNAAYALEMAGILADKKEGKVVAFTIRHPKAAAGFDVEALIETHAERLLPRDRIEIKSIVHDDVVTAILHEAEGEEDYDLIAMGCSLEPFIRQVGRESIPQAVARLCTRPMVMAKSSAGIRSWISKWI
ncbi:amino acid permease, partial [Verrucomicrobiota bacterium]